MAFLLLLQDGVPKTRLSLSETVTVGRSSTCEVQVLTPGLSRTHARIEQRGDGWWISDLGSRNGTFIKGNRIEAPTRLKDGDNGAFGTVSFVFNPPVDLIYERDGDHTVYLLDGEDAGGADVEGLAAHAPEPDADTLRTALDLTCELAAELSVDKLLPALLSRLRGIFGADRGVVMTRASSGEWTPRAVLSDKGNLAVSRSLLDRAISGRKPLLFHDAVEQVSFVGARSVMEHRLRSVMLAPIYSERGTVGVIQLDCARPNAFSQKTLAALALLTRPAAVSIENALLFENEVRKNAAAVGREVSGILTADPSMERLIAAAERAAASTARVLITGESGTGKELVARMIHRASPRADKPFVAVNCGAILETVLESELFGHEKGAFTGAVKKRRGCFELADGGTLFLDEVGELAPATQVKLLRVLQEGTFVPVGAERPIRVDVRLVAATNRDLRRMVQAGDFREDLFFRLNVIPLEIPPLRERKADIPILADAFLSRFARGMSRKPLRLTQAAAEALAGYRWPGNVRELQNLAERWMVLCTGETIDVSDLPPEITGPSTEKAISDGDLKGALSALERRMIAQVLSETGGNKSEACRRLGISRPTLDKKIAEHHLET